MSASAMGVCSWSLRPNNADELMDALEAVGLKKVQLGLTPIVEEPAAWVGVFDRLKASGIEIVSGMYGPKGEDYSTLETIAATGGLAVDEHWEDNRVMAEKVAAIAKAEGIEVMTFHAGFIPHDQNDPVFGKLCERINTVADIFKAAGSVTLFETGQETAEDLNAFLDYLNREDVGINFDPANMILYGKGDPIESLRKLIGRVKQVHVKDANATKTVGTWGSEECVGTGEVDWDAFVGVLKEHGFGGEYVIEREAGESRVEDIKKAKTLIESML
ncbi:Inosose dehydratase [Poriferisphaera corsica]|uniref:Inosose dehydratase n=1 Tax=Poriferisphaera corsica TaxID=2528020 RepID=A0A517YZ78_9BACT|nr:sugar phosphate isomerase/epimerase family protein [Poriferisphaera corsica]QDU35532.1 Inosose dehydratase [Poriferisphaera corsica]